MKLLGLIGIIKKNGLSKKEGEVIDKVISRGEIKMLNY